MRLPIFKPAFVSMVVILILLGELSMMQAGKLGRRLADTNELAR